MSRVRVVVRDHMGAVFDLTGAEKVSLGTAYKPESGIQVTYVRSGAVERRDLGAATPVLAFLVGWAAGHGLDRVVAFLYRHLRGKVNTIEIEGEEVLLEEAEMLEALRRATGESEEGERTT